MVKHLSFTPSFNLVIEVLLSSSGITSHFGSWQHCFNLVIEVLLSSSKDEKLSDADKEKLFQSRNRGSFEFKEEVNEHWASHSNVSIS